MAVLVDKPGEEMMNMGQENGIKRVQDARRDRNFWQRIWAAGSKIIGGIRDIIFVIAIGCLIGIGFGIGMALFFTWM